MGQGPNSIADILAAALRLFRSNTKLTTWDAVEEVVEGISTPQLLAIYRSSTRAHPWCAEALAHGGDNLVTLAIQNLAAQLRQDPQVRQLDEIRFRLPTAPRQSRSRPGSKPRRRS